MSYYITRKDQLPDVLSFIANNSLLAYDVEATGLDPHTEKVLLIQIGNKQRQFVLDVHKLGNELIQVVLEKLNSEDIVKIMHNGKYDYQMTLTNFGVELHPIADTLLADHLLSQGKKANKHSLDIVLEKYLGVTVNKEQQSSFIGMELGDDFTDYQLEYARIDTEFLVPLFAHLTSLLKERDMYDLSLLEYNTIRATAALELNGIHIDPVKWLALQAIAQKKADEYKAELDGYFRPFCKIDMFGGLDVNYNSPKQLLALLPKITGKAIKSTAKAVLQNMTHPAVKALLNYRRQTKRVSTYGEEFLNKHLHPITKRLHSSFWQLGGTETGRYASKDPNMQNIPREAVYRAAFTAKNKDYRIVCADFSNQELRLLIHLSKEPKFLQWLDEGKDLHQMSASLIFDVPYEDVTKAQRNAAKSTTFGNMYGMGPGKLANELNIPFEEAQALQASYFRNFPRIKALMRFYAAEAREKKYAYSPLDKRREDLSNIDFDNGGQARHAENIAKNFPFQGAGASITKLALYKVHDELKKHKLDAYLVNVVHDEILVEAHKDHAEQVANIVQKEMVKAFNHFAPDIKMEVQPEIENHWVH
jgi:DNA polymerase I